MPRSAKQADRLWLDFAATADADGLTDFAGLQALIVRGLVESGEVLVRLRERRTEDGLPVPLQLQVLEADHLDSWKTGELADGGFILQGIEFDALGRRRAYWLYPTHPGDGRGGLVSHRVPADRVLHLFERLRPGQVRGVPWFAPVMLKLRDLDAYDEAELVRKKIEACFAAFVTGVQDEETLGKARTEPDGARIETFEPGMIEYLEPGRDVKFASPSASGGYAEYMRMQLHAVAAGVGLTYELLTGDLSQVNYSSIRAGLIEFRRRMEALQWQLLVPGLCQPVWRRFVLAAQAAGKLPDGDIGCRLDRAALRGGRPDEGHPGRHPRGARRRHDAEGGDRAPGLRAGTGAGRDRRDQRRARCPRHHPRHRPPPVDPHRPGEAAAGEAGCRRSRLIAAVHHGTRRDRSICRCRPGPTSG